MQGLPCALGPTMSRSARGGWRAKAAGAGAATRGRQRPRGRRERASPRTPGSPSAGGTPPVRGCGPVVPVSSSAGPAGRPRQRPGNSHGIDAAPPVSGGRWEKLPRCRPRCAVPSRPPRCKAALPSRCTLPAHPAPSRPYQGAPRGAGRQDGPHESALGAHRGGEGRRRVRGSGQVDAGNPGAHVLGSAAGRGGGGPRPGWAVALSPLLWPAALPPPGLGLR